MRRSSGDRAVRARAVEQCVWTASVQHVMRKQKSQQHGARTSGVYREIERLGPVERQANQARNICQPNQAPGDAREPSVLTADA